MRVKRRRSIGRRLIYYFFILMEKLELDIEGMHCFRSAYSGTSPETVGFRHSLRSLPSNTGNRMDGSPTPSFRNT